MIFVALYLRDGPGYPRFGFVEVPADLMVKNKDTGTPTLALPAPPSQEKSPEEEAPVTPRNRNDRELWLTSPSRLLSNFAFQFER